MMQHPIASTFSRLAALDEPHRSWFLVAPDHQPGWTRVGQIVEPGSPLLAEMLRRVRTRYVSRGLQPPAAMFFGHFIYSLQIVSAACLMLDRRVPETNLECLWVRFDAFGDVEGLAWTGRRFAALYDDPAHLHRDCQVVMTTAQLRNCLSAQLQDNLSPLVDAVSAASTLGKPALWALAADYFVYAFLAAGKLLGSEASGVVESCAFSDCRSKLSATKRVIPVVHAGGEGYLVDRTACCLYYKIEGGGYCHSCPHRPLDERIGLVERQLAERTAAPE